MSSSPISSTTSNPYTPTEQNDSATKVDRLPVAVPDSSAPTHHWAPSSLALINPNSTSNTDQTTTAQKCNEVVTAPRSDLKPCDKADENPKDLSPQVFEKSENNSSISQAIDTSAPINAPQAAALDQNFFTNITLLKKDIIVIVDPHRFLLTEEETQLYQNILSTTLSAIDHQDLQELLDLDILFKREESRNIANNPEIGRIIKNQQDILALIQASMNHHNFPNLGTSIPSNQACPCLTWIEDNSTGNKVDYAPYCMYMIQGKLHVMLYNATVQSAVQNSVLKVVVGGFLCDIPFTLDILNNPAFGINPGNFSATFAIVVRPTYLNGSLIGAKAATFYTKI